jgi:hypothetical protein
MKRPPSVLLCLLLLLVCDVALRVLGFARTLRLARRIAGEKQAEVPDELIDKTLHNVIVATVLYPGRSKCLEQAVASFILLRRRGVPAEVRFGIQPYPFFAHAWVELNGAPLNESPEVIGRFALMPDPVL